MTLLDVLCNISLVHGYKNVSNWFIGNISFSHPENELIKVFVDNSENRVLLLFFLLLLLFLFNSIICLVFEGHKFLLYNLDKFSLKNK